MFVIISADLSQIVTLIGISLIAIISPGPDFAIVVKNSLIYSRRVGIFTALGIAVAALIHATYTILGFGALIAETHWLFVLIKYAGAGYLIHIGIKGVKAKKTLLHFGDTTHRKEISTISAFKTGFITCALNPKAILFFIGMFSVVITDELSFGLMILYISIIFIETIIWFSIVALCLSAKKTRDKFSSSGYIIERVTGFVLIVLALKLIFTSL